MRPHRLASWVFVAVFLPVGLLAGSGGALAQNTPPTVITTPTGPFSIAENKTLSFTVSATDPDAGNVITLSQQTALTNSTFNPTTGAFSFTPDCAQSGTYNITFRANDGVANTDLVVGITVTDRVLTFTPASKAYGTLRVGETSSQVFRITNAGAAAFSITTLDTSGAPFAITAGMPTLPHVLDKDGFVDVTVTFAPTAGVASAGSLRVRTDDAACSNTTAALSGTGQSNGISFSTTSIDYNDVRVGVTTNPAISIIVTNTGQSTWKLPPPAATGEHFVRTVPALPDGQTEYTLLPTNTVTFTVAAKPTSVGEKLDSLVLNTDIPNRADDVISLRVNGVAPGIASTAPSIDFGGVDVDGPPDSETVTISNDGTFPLSVALVRITGPGSGRYTITEGTGAGPIAVGGSRDITVAYDPILESAGEPAATLEVWSDALGETLLSMPLGGRGTDRHIGLSAMALDFGAIRRNATTQQTVTIENTGGAPLAIGEGMLQGDGAAAFGVALSPTVLAPGTSMTLPITFTPSAAAQFDAELIIPSDDDGAPMARIDLTGLGQVANVLAAPGSLAPLTAPVGIRRTLTERVLVSNLSSVDAEVTLVCVALAASEICDPASPFTVRGWTGARALPGLSEIELELEFAPEVAGLYSGRVLVFLDGDPLPLLFVTISGQGIDDVVLSGGGCGVAGGGAGGVVFILIALALLVGRRAWRALLVVAVVLAARPAAADPATSFDLGVFRPTLPTRASFITVEPPEIHRAGVFGVGLTFDYAKNPLQARRAGSETMDTPVADRSELVLALAYALPRVQLQVEVPFLHQQGAVGATGLPAADGSSLGDVAAGARIALWNNRRAALGLSVRVAFPTGDAQAYAGSDGVVAQGSLIAGVRAGRLRVAGNFGFRGRSAAAELGGVRQGNELIYGTGVAVRLISGLDAIGEVFGAAALGSDAGEVAPLEGLLGARFWATDGLAVSAGAGLGLVSGIGAPDVRLFAGVAWFPGESSLRGGKVGVGFDGVRDADEDGVADARDRCTQVAEDRDGFQDDDGCPDGDDDGDAIADALDKCRRDAEDKDGFQDDDGCPDPDNDGDKVADARDKCPTEIEDLDGFRDEDGCVDADNDGDGMADEADLCPLEPETVNGNNDVDGCPDAGESLVMVLPDKIELLAPIEFSGDGANLKAASRNVLGQVATALRVMPKQKVRVSVHVHKRGSTQSDYQLSLKRGEAVKRLLVERGVAADRLEVKPWGSSKPLGTSRDLNDRIEFQMLQSPK